jgi:hypothetical protein
MDYRKMQEHSKDIESFAQSLTIVFAFAMISALAILAAYYFNFGTGLSSDHVRWAEFGNFAGGTIGPLVSFFAFFALLITLALQNKSIRISKEELELTRKELSKTSEAARAQAEHFNNVARLSDVIESIKELEEEIKRRKNNHLLGWNIEKCGIEKLRLVSFLERDTLYLARFTHGDDGSTDNLIAQTRHEEIGEIFQLLFEQIISLRDIPDARNRYRIFMKKHLETFYYLAQVGTFQFDWIAPLDVESKNDIKRFEKEHRVNLKAIEAEVQAS